MAIEITPGVTITGGVLVELAPVATVPTVIGQAFGGGYYAGQISTAGNGVADYYLVVAPKSSGQSNSLQWKTSATETAGTSSQIDGPSNSNAMNDASHPAAQFCKGLTIGGYSDWYMPARNELEVCYYNLKPTTDNNHTSSGINPNAVPARNSNYTASVPAQTSATDFQAPSGAERFDTALYWSSSQWTAVTSYAWTQIFGAGAYASGTQNLNPKNQTQRVRAVRRVAV